MIEMIEMISAMDVRSHGYEGQDLMSAYTLYTACIQYY